MMKFFRRFKDLGMEGAQAIMYDKMTRENRMQEMKEEAKEVASYIKEGDSALEVAPGPGYLLIELAKLGNYKLTGMDISLDTVKIAIHNAKEAGVSIEFKQGNVSTMPFKDNSFDFIISVLSFKNFREPVKALQEMHRVLSPGSTALIMDLNRNASPEQMKAFVKSMGLRGFNAFVAGKLQQNGAYTRQEFEDFISQTKFKGHSIKDTKMGFSIYLKK